MRRLTLLALIAALGCAGIVPRTDAQPPIRPVAQLDLSRFMGRWYVIASIPTRFESHAWNAVETYALQPDGNVYTSFRFNNGAADGPVKHIHSIGYVQPGTGNAVWGVQVFWFLKAQYIVAYLKPDYSEMIVARDARDYTWVMARTPTVSATDWDTLTTRLKTLGYDLSKLRRVPQQWPAATVPALARK